MPRRTPCAHARARAHAHTHAHACIRTRTHTSDNKNKIRADLCVGHVQLCEGLDADNGTELDLRGPGRVEVQPEGGGEEKGTLGPILREVEMTQSGM